MGAGEALRRVLECLASGILLAGLDMNIDQLDEKVHLSAHISGANVFDMKNIIKLLHNIL